MNIGLIDVDSHNWPNLALMKISAYHKSIGDHVEWWDGFAQYDRVYMSRVFDDTYSQDEPEPCNAAEIVKGGTGYGLQNLSLIHILVIDNDKQGNLSKAFGVHSYDHKSIADIMLDRNIDLSGVIRHTRYAHIDVIPVSYTHLDVYKRQAPACGYWLTCFVPLE